MILKSFLLGNLVSLCMKIINSVVVVGLYYGFLTTFSIGPSYLFLLRAHVMEEGNEKKVSATTGFITGQLIMFISIYYAPLHLALGRPHTITVLALPYLLFHFFCNNHKHFFDYGSTTRNSMRNLSIQCVFLNNLIFQLFNHFILPSSMLARLVNIFMFRCNSKMLFVTSSFVGWIIGHILFMKWIGLLLVWIRQNRSIRKYIQSNKYLVSELKNSMSMAGIFSIFLLVTCVYYLGRIPSPIFSNKLNKLDKMEEEEEFDNNSPIDYMYGDQENLKFKILEKNKKDEEKYFFLFEKPLLTFFFDYNRWNRPLRYIRKRNKKLKGSVRKEASQYFFYTCQSDGKQRISFTYPPSLSTFCEMLAKRISLSTLEKLSADELYSEWLYTNKDKNNNLNNEFINRIEALETVFLSLNILETKTRLCNVEKKNKKNCLIKMYDPFLNGMYRGRMKKIFSSSIRKENSIENCTEPSEINKIHDILLPYPTFPESEQKIEISEKKQVKIDSNNRLKFSLNAILTNPKREKKSIGININEIGKKPPRWSYKLINELEQMFKKRRKEQGIMQGLDHQLRTRKFKRIDFLTRSKRSFKKSNFKNYNLYTKFNRDSGFISYLEEPDFRRAVIKGSMRSQRRKMVIWGPSQGNPHSPLFLEKMEDFPFPISDLMNLFFNIRDWLGKKSEFEILDQQFQIKKNNQEDAMEFWENIPYAQKTRSILLLAQSIFRRYIKLPLLIIAKNIGRILLRQSPEWYEDFQDWNREIYLKCSYNGLQFSKTEFPKNWLIEGFQIKILYPFHLKPWHGSKLRLSDRDRKQQDDFDSCFLTVLGMETEYPFGPPRKTPSFFEPVFKDIDYKVEIRNFNFRVQRVLKKITKQQEKAFFFLKQILLKGKKIPLFIPREIYESSETQTEKDSIISTQIIHESFSQNKSRDYSQAKEEIKHRIDRRNTIRNQIEIMKKNKKNNRESPPKIWKILKRKNIELIFQFCIEKIYVDIFLCIINMRRISLQLFMESTKKILEKYIDNNEINKDKARINKKKQNKIDFISPMTIKKAFDNLRNSKQKPHIFFDLSYLSQKYVFFKLSQTQVINFNKLRSILQYNGPSFFLKNEIKDFFGTQGIFDSKVRHNKLSNYEKNPWKNWLRSHYQYDLSQITWSTLVPQKWRNQINQCHMSQNDDLKKGYFYEKDPLLDYKKKQNLKVYLLPNKEDNFQKNYRYDLFSYKYMNSETKNKSDIYRSPLETIKKQENSTKNKETFFNILNNIPIKNYLEKSDIIYMEKNTDRKYLGWKFNTNIQVEPNKDQITENSHNNGLFYLPIKSNSKINYKKVFFDWMGMNEKLLILNHLISNPKVFLFPEFLILYHKYKEKPWFIPSNLLLFNLNINPNFSENPNIKGKQEADEYFLNFRPSNSKQYFELKNQNNIEEYFLESIEKLKVFLKGDFPFQLRWTGRLNQLNQKMMNNIQIYGLLLSLINVRKITISYIQRKEMNLDIMRRRLNLTQLTKKGILIMEPTRLSVKNDGQFFMYQIIGISLVHKSKHQSNQRYRNPQNVAKNNFDESIPRRKRKTLNKDKNNYDLLVPEKILSSRRRRELRILISFNLNLKNQNGAHRNKTFSKENKIKNWSQFLDESKNFDRKKNELIKLKLFFWPNYRLEDLACMNRYWFDTNNGSRLSMLRIYMYP
nr:Ycf1 [Seriphidium minchunense]YP_010622269.1 Ycf1 [Seriphidium sawanense]YP_010622356.1 Ycf1 [Artemisia schrenkiana]YP_010622443.1 Ycf1 [Artemisia scopiformis]YP_010622704.1 Ycf1 [Artemisia transiliensis]WBF91820.1 Ycf1 [Seriphidium minchunense]WBF91907.1 Ycf1 [Seriphidium minchunense]WBF92168.1 Ycf1 [Seriphidium sawanense]WBF92255.1 Ycf1 [Artemisia schrenkiana]WBF92342.1 Ycf1 [Artemisia scopiformis]